jgi:hypothetical protein
MSDAMVLTSGRATKAWSTTRVASVSLVGAAVLFGLAWFFMPVAGVTDAEEIFRIVTPQRGAVLAASILALVASTLYVPAMIGVIRSTDLPFHSKVWRPAAVLTVGTLGLATDAIDHLLAYAMTAPGVDQSAQVEVMAWMQGPALLLISPLIASFFVGAVWLSVAFARAGAISRWNPGLYGVALGIAVVGAVLATATELISTRTVGVLTLGTVAVAQAWLGVVLWTQPRAAATAVN